MPDRRRSQCRECVAEQGSLMAMHEKEKPFGSVPSYDPQLEALEDFEILHGKLFSEQPAPLPPDVVVSEEPPVAVVGVEVTLQVERLAVTAKDLLGRGVFPKLFAIAEDDERVTRLEVIAESGVVGALRHPESSAPSRVPL